MIRVDQTLFGVGTGNCFAACIACFAEVPIAEVPNFCCLEGDWYAECNRWLIQRGFRIGFWEMELPGFVHEMRRLNPNRDFYWIAGGTCPPRKSNPGGPHVCVYLNDRLWHDPNPERTGLIKTDCAFLVNRDPVKQPRDPQWLAGHICP